MPNVSHQRTNLRLRRSLIVYQSEGSWRSSPFAETTMTLPASNGHPRSKQRIESWPPKRRRANPITMCDFRLPSGEACKNGQFARSDQPHLNFVAPELRLLGSLQESQDYRSGNEKACEHCLYRAGRSRLAMP